MKVFLSWSGELSHEVARVLHEWLPLVLQAVHPYMSSKDIEKGARWGADIARELQDANYGILCLTRSNLEKPWLQFEAGSLAKSLDSSNVTPFLLNLKPSNIAQSNPLVHFQATNFEEEDVRRLVMSINSKVEGDRKLSDDRLNSTFSRWWPELKQDLDNLISREDSFSESPSPTARSERAILEELLEIAREQQRAFLDLDRVSQPDYFRWSARKLADSSHLIETIDTAIKLSVSMQTKVIKSNINEQFKNDLVFKLTNLISILNEVRPTDLQGLQGSFRNPFRDGYQAFGRPDYPPAIPPSPEDEHE